MPLRAFITVRDSEGDLFAEKPHYIYMKRRMYSNYAVCFQRLPRTALNNKLGIIFKHLVCKNKLFGLVQYFYIKALCNPGWRDCVSHMYIIYFAIYKYI